jgi:ribokinase
MVVEIAVVGSCNLDLVVGVDHVPLVGETVLGGDLQRIPGGKGANQAVAAARLGRSVAMVGRLGDDSAAEILRGSLEVDGVNTAALLSTPGVASGVALISVQGDGDNAIVVSPGANARVTADDVVAADAVREATVVLAQAEIPIDAVVAAAKVATGTMIWNPAPAPAGRVPEELFHAVDIIVPNQSELAALVGYRDEVGIDVAVELASRLPSSAVVVTLGGDGALVVAEGESTHVPAPRVRPVDTTAAGDSFCAALADRIVSGDDLIAATTWAVQVGAATTLRAGAQPSLPTVAEVNSLLGATS